MEKTCLHCQENADERYRLNEYGQIFCNDDCYERYYQVNDTECYDMNHPYIDDYESIRSNYIDWIENWEDDLDKVTTAMFNKNLQYKVDSMLDTIDEVFEKYRDYYVTEGDDGVFAREIYLYLLKFEELQKEILQWRPEKREVFFYLSIELDRDVIEKEVDRWEVFAEILHDICAEDLYEMLKKNVHPYDFMSFYFATQEELDDVKQKLEQTFNEDIISIYDAKAHRCDGACYDIEVMEDVNMEEQNGWFFCYSCEKFYYPGYFTIEELQKEIKQCDNNPNLSHIAKSDDWHYYIRKIKRSCRYYDIDYPAWIDLEYDF